MKIVVCVDGSDNATKAFEEALTYYKNDDSTLVVLVGYESGGRFSSDADNERRRAVAEQIAAPYRDTCASNKVAHAEFVLVGGPSVKEALVDKIEEVDPDLCVVGSRGLGAVKRLFLGSFSNFVVHHVKCDVLVVK